jgi:hypothetical protein
MRIIYAMIVLTALCFAAYAQSVVVSNGPENVQSVSGDFAKSWLKSYLEANPRPAPKINDTSLWGWGTIPKGKALIEGQIVDSLNFTASQDMTANWLGDYYLNPYTSEPIDPRYYPGYAIPVYSNPVYYDPYIQQQRLPLNLFYP